MTLEQLDLGKKAEVSSVKLKEKLRLFGGRKPLPGTGLHIDPEKMKQEFESHTASDGRPPIGSAQDD